MSKAAKIIYALSTLAGTIIGVGLFALPYITVRVGIWVMLGYFVALTAIVILIHLFFGQVALHTKDFLRLPGYAEIHLGRWGKRIALFSMILGFWGTILAYIVVGGEFLHNLASPVLGGSYFFYSLLYFSAGAALIFFGIKAISKIEFWGLVLFFAVLFGVFLRSADILNFGNLFLKLGGRNELFLPYGAILFSLWGAALIPEVEEMLGGRKNLLGKIIAAAVLVAALVYIFFIVLIVGITGAQTSQEAIVGLGNALGDSIVSLMLLFGILTTFTSFIALGLTLKKVFWYDLNINKNISWAIACLTPLLFFWLGFQDFIVIIGFVGGVTLAIEGVLIILMYRKLVVERQEERIGLEKFYFLIYPLIAVLALGVIYEVFYFFK